MFVYCYSDEFLFDYFMYFVYILFFFYCLDNLVVMFMKYRIYSIYENIVYFYGKIINNICIYEKLYFIYKYIRYIF